MSSGGERPGPHEPLDSWRRTDEPDTARWVADVQQATERWGAAFVAYLLLPDIDPRDPEAEQSFVDSYAGWYPDRGDLMRAQLASLGWNDALSHFHADQGLPPHALNFDYAEIWDHCADVYEVVERLGGVYAFLR